MIQVSVLFSKCRITLVLNYVAHVADILHTVKQLMSYICILENSTYLNLRVKKQSRGVSTIPDTFEYGFLEITPMFLIFYKKKCGHYAANGLRCYCYRKLKISALLSDLCWDSNFGHTILDKRHDQFATIESHYLYDV